MNRIALILAAACVIIVGIGGTPAQAHDSWGYGSRQWSENQWRGHEWRGHEWRREPHVTIIRGSHIYNR